MNKRFVNVIAILLALSLVLTGCDGIQLPFGEPSEAPEVSSSEPEVSPSPSATPTPTPTPSPTPSPSASPSPSPTPTPTPTPTATPKPTGTTVPTVPTPTPIPGAFNITYPRTITGGEYTVITITADVADGVVTLNNVTADMLIIEGGGQVNLMGCTIEDVELHRPHETVTLRAGSTTEIENVTLYTPAVITEDIGMTGEGFTTVSTEQGYNYAYIDVELDNVELESFEANAVTQIVESGSTEVDAYRNEDNIRFEGEDDDNITSWPGSTSPRPSATPSQGSLTVTEGGSYNAVNYDTVIIHASVANDTVTFDNSNIDTLYIYGGGRQTIELGGDTEVDEIIVNKQDIHTAQNIGGVNNFVVLEPPRILLRDEATVGSIDIESECIIDSDGNSTVNLSTVSVNTFAPVTINAKLTTLNINDPSHVTLGDRATTVKMTDAAILDISGSVSISSVSVTGNSSSTVLPQIHMSTSGSQIGKLTSTVPVRVTGQGVVTTISASAQVILSEDIFTNSNDQVTERDKTITLVHPSLVDIEAGQTTQVSPYAVSTDDSVDLDNVSYRYYSSNTSVFRVDSVGNVTGVSPGVATLLITAETAGNTAGDRLNVQVAVSPDSATQNIERLTLEINTEGVVMGQGESKVVKENVRILGEDGNVADGVKVTMESSNEDIATASYSGGKITVTTQDMEGSAVITVTATKDATAGTLYQSAVSSFIVSVDPLLSVTTAKITSDELISGEYAKSMAQLSSNLSAEGRVTYLWQVSDDGTSGWETAIGGTATSMNYLIPYSYVGKYLRVTVTGQLPVLGKATSNIVGPIKENLGTVSSVEPIISQADVTVNAIITGDVNDGTVYAVVDLVKIPYGHSSSAPDDQVIVSQSVLIEDNSISVLFEDVPNNNYVARVTCKRSGHILESRSFVVSLGVATAEELTMVISLEIGPNHNTPVYVLKQGDYTDATWLAYEEALADAITLENNIGDYTTEELPALITTAINNLAQAKSRLTFVNQPDLDAARRDVGNVSQQDYTEESWSEFITARAGALEMPELNNDQIIAKTNALLDSLDLLVLKPLEMQELQDYVDNTSRYATGIPDENGNYRGSDGNYYLPEGWSTLVTAHNKAVALLISPTATQDSIDDMYAELILANTSLQQAKVDAVNFSRPSGVVDRNIDTLSLSVSTTGAVIRYRVGTGSTYPNPYEGIPISFASMSLGQVSITAQATLTGYLSSDAVTVNYEVKDNAQTTIPIFTIDPDKNNYNHEEVVTVTFAPHPGDIYVLVTDNQGTVLTPDANQEGVQVILSEDVNRSITISKGSAVSATNVATHYMKALAKEGSKVQSPTEIRDFTFLGEQTDEQKMLEAHTSLRTLEFDVVYDAASLTPIILQPEPHINGSTYEVDMVLKYDGIEYTEAGTGNGGVAASTSPGGFLDISRDTSGEYRFLVSVVTKIKAGTFDEQSTDPKYFEVTVPSQEPDLTQGEQVGGEVTYGPVSIVSGTTAASRNDLISLPESVGKLVNQNVTELASGYTVSQLINALVPSLGATIDIYTGSVAEGGTKIEIAQGNDPSVTSDMKIIVTSINGTVSPERSISTIDSEAVAEAVTWMTGSNYNNLLTTVTGATNLQVTLTDGTVNGVSYKFEAIPNSGQNPVHVSKSGNVTTAIKDAVEYSFIVKVTFTLRAENETIYLDLTVPTSVIETSDKFEVASYNAKQARIITLDGQSVSGDTVRLDDSIHPLWPTWTLNDFLSYLVPSRGATVELLNDPEADAPLNLGDETALVKSYPNIAIRVTSIDGTVSEVYETEQTVTDPNP